MTKKTYQVLNEITVSRGSLRHNYNYFAKLNPQAKVAVVLKANAYGHGLCGIAKFIDEEHSASFICVDSLYEAYELYKQGIKTPILIMGYTNPKNFDVWRHLPFTFSVFDTATLRALEKYQPGARVHVKLDTGMARLGLQKSDIKTFLRVLKECPSLQVEGIFSHLSQADDPSKITFTNRQIMHFKEMTALFETAGYTFKWRHIAATAGASFIRDSYFNLIRLGLGFYGYTPFGPHTKEGRVGRLVLRPALKLVTHIAQIKKILVGTQVGYGGTYTAKQKETIAILPIGYNEGVPLELSNRGVFYLQDGTACPIIGRVSMDMTTVKLPRNAKTKVGDLVMFDSISHTAQLSKIFAYTILTKLHPSIHRRMIT